MVVDTLASAAANVADHSSPMIRLDQLSRWFGTTCAVSRVSFEVGRGEVFGFIGPNGAGKTTSMRILATLDVPTSGDAFVDGFSVVDDPDQVRRRLGFMPDGFGVYPNVNCEEYLDFFARAYGLRGKERIRALRYVMGFTQLDQMAHKPINGLSKGMKQRLCLGRTLIHDPQVLILDEPAAGLDPRARIELRDMILQLADEGKSLLISSHILTELAEMCSRVAIIEQGGLLAVGSVDDILSGDLSIDEGEGERPPRQLATCISIDVGVLDDVEKLQHWLQTQEGIKGAAIVGKLVRIEAPNDQAFHAELIARMVHEGFPVVSFTPKQRSLEEAFLHVTKGRVQ